MPMDGRSLYVDVRIDRAHFGSIASYGYIVVFLTKFGSFWDDYLEVKQVMIEIGK